MDSKVNKTYESPPDDLHTLETKTPERELNIHQNLTQDENHAKGCKHQPPSCTEWIINISPDASISINEAVFTNNTKKPVLRTEKPATNIIDLSLVKKRNPHTKSSAPQKYSNKHKKSFWKKLFIMVRMFLRKLR